MSVLPKDTSNTLTVFTVVLLRLLILKLHKPKSKTSLGQLKSHNKKNEKDSTEVLDHSQDSPNKNDE